MRVTLLGTGGSAGVPMIGGADGHGDWGACDPAEPRNVRTRASIAVDGGQGVLLVDTPPDMRMQLLSCGIKQVDAILYTHAHADHVTGWTMCGCSTASSSGRWTRSPAGKRSTSCSAASATRSCRGSRRDSSDR